MESGLRETDRVIVASSDEYIRKANIPAGGVGYEKRIISAQIASDLGVNHVIPLIRNNTSKPPVPTFLSSLNYIDFRKDEQFEAKYAELIFELHGERMLPRPELGPNPFLRQSGHDVERALTVDPQRYASQLLENLVEFDYLNNDGRFTIGTGDRTFTLSFSAAEAGHIHVYNDPSDMEWISVAPQIEIDAIANAWAYDSSSRTRMAQVADTIILRNTAGHFAAVTIDDVRARDSQTGSAKIKFHYRVALHGSSDLSERELK